MATVKWTRRPGKRLAMGLSLCLVGLGPSGPVGGAGDGRGPAVVKVLKVDGGYRLLRDGTPYFIKGAGGDGSQEALAKAGGNSVRTWGADKAGQVLDEAQRRGLTVTLGIWLGHGRQGFNYNDADQVARQADEVRRTILKYKDHPALLMWGLGNEMEGDGGDAAVWSAINNLASLAKRLDPNHPTMTVIAEIGGAKVRNLHRLCPEIDVVGINSYGGIDSLPARYKAAGGEKPYVVTEFGPAGQWEIQKTPWDAAPEPTSTEKAATYRRAYQRAIAGAPGVCLGSYAFLWGHKQEATATWFGLLLPDGSRTGGADALAEIWSGKAPANRCPTVKPILLSGPARVAPGAALTARLEAADPEGDPLKVDWTLLREGAYGAGGDAEAAPESIPGAILKADASHAELKLPKDGGGYRLFAYVRDGHGGAATANVPLFVDGPASTTAAGGKSAKLPLVIYAEAGAPETYVPSGYMGSTRAIKLDPGSTDNPHAGKTCMRADFTDTQGWGGVVWQNPANDWGDRPGGFDLTGAKRLTFWARGAEGGEAVSFEFGLIPREKKFSDTAKGSLGKVKLVADWTQYSIDLAGKDLSRIKTGFVWVVAAEGKPVTFYLDDIRFE